jgi:hypothetical protein
MARRTFSSMEALRGLHLLLLYSTKSKLVAHNPRSVGSLRNAVHAILSFDHFMQAHGMTQGITHHDGVDQSTPPLLYRRSPFEEYLLRFVHVLTVDVAVTYASFLVSQILYILRHTSCECPSDCSTMVILLGLPPEKSDSQC